MGTFHCEPTKIAEWRTLVLQAQEKAGLQLSEPIENYVVITLDAYTQFTTLSATAIAIDYLEQLQNLSRHNMHVLRGIGDQCLILSGLFPDRAKRKNVSKHYFMRLGKSAYYILSSVDIAWKLDNTLFYQLFESFSDLTSVLRSMRA